MLGTGYYMSHLEEIPYTHRRHAILFVSQRSERAIGSQTFDMLRREAVENGTLLAPGHPYSQLVAYVGSKIAQVAGDGGGGGYQEHMKGLTWEFAVVDSPQVNAMVMPGGKVVVFTGLLRLVRHEDELAAVLAHEAAHVLARHTAEQLGRVSMLSVVSIVTNLFLGIPVSPNLLLLAFGLPHSRAAESEADAIGIRLLARCCYDPEANVRMLQRLSTLERGADAPGGGAPVFLRTHPLTEERVRRVRDLLPEAYKEYQGSCHAVEGAWRDLVRVF